MAAAASQQHRRVFVGNIPYDATEEQLIQICEEVGPVVSFRLVLDRETGKPKGYGFCEYKDEETALSARRNLQGYEINGRQLRVDFAENDKNSDRNREQGRGGPGLTSNADAYKAVPGPPVLGDSTLHQPIGLPLAVTAASTMARTLGGSQTSNLPLTQNGSLNLSGLGNDPLTQYLSKMSRQQLQEIMSEMKALVLQNKQLAQQLLTGISQLPKALFQAQIMLNMVTPQMMQMASTRQSLSSVPNLTQPPQHGQTPSQNETLAVPLFRPPETHPSNALQNPLNGLQQSVLPFQHVPVQPPIQQPLPPQSQIHPQGMMLGRSGGPTRPQSFVNLPSQPQVPPLPNSTGFISQVQPPFLLHSRPDGPTNVSHHPPPALLDKSVQPSYLPHPTAAQAGSSSYPALLNGLETLSKEAGTSTSASPDLSFVSRANMLPTSGVRLAGQMGEISGVLNNQSKRPRLEEGGGTHPSITNGFHTSSSVSAQAIDAGRMFRSQMANNADVKQESAKQTPQMPLDAESALLQQVMNLTPEQLTSLPVEQRQQVLQLQQMLVEGRR
ncbi:cleavage stimulating factor 64-like [Iris pallida]|uniref:Cleavage stimulating factor 64-like n=1 Tax=Iris pallida TaxID=29817 RepID=A0AAX6FQK3_IRIPA|nr:cleavage stimulating factor 64-like [Iris pallida]